jgi:quercetin dioxygenase-like cupin family protein
VGGRNAGYTVSRRGLPSSDVYFRWHPAMEDRFTVLRGRVGFRLAGKEQIAEPGREIHVSAGLPHDWWNAGDQEARVRVEIRPAARFEVLMYLNIAFRRRFAKFS